ncbi:Sorting assembly machinery 50 kDa subunit [Spathaspora sp. JA1]|nr:Sorting assembly machinery 50 kDa subunit [Spathaspora sp. JA1]
MSQDYNDEFIDNIKRKDSNKHLSEAEKELEKLKHYKETFMIDQNKQFIETLFKDHKSNPIKIRNVQVTNSQTFRDSFIKSQVQPLLVTDQAISLESFLGEIESISKKFLKLGIVDNLLVSVQPVNPPSQSIFSRKKFVGSNATLHVVPIFNIIPKKKFYAKTGTNIGNGEGDGYIQFQIKNIFGGGENLEFDATSGTKTQSSYILNYNQPILNNANYRLENLFYINTRKFDWIQANVTGRGMTNKIHTMFEGPINHELILENYWKVLNNYGSKSLEVLSQAGSQYKSSLCYNFIYDSRNNQHLPTFGKYFQFGVEYNGLVKYVKYPFVKTAGQIQLSYTLPKIKSSIITSLKSGILYPLGPTSSVLDRFYIGGPNDVRSFMLNGLGPKDFNSSIGGDIFLNGGVSLITDIPRYPESGFKLHNFFNFGRIIKMNKQQGIIDNFKQLTHSHSLSYGIGILFNHPMARFELNLVVPIIAHERDSVRKGIQYGIGVSFL